MDSIDRKSIFKNNPKNAHFFNHGNDNINVNGDRNTVIKTTNIYNHPPKKIRIIEDHHHVLTFISFSLSYELLYIEYQCHLHLVYIMTL